MKKIVLLLALLTLPFFVLAAETIDINNASLNQLEDLSGIGPTYAQRIIDGRPYSSVDDLLLVKGIGSKTLQKIKAQGFACVNCQTETTSQTSQNPTATTSPTVTPTVAVAPTYASGIFINEIMPDPSGPDETDEWFELYNSNSVPADLSGWKIQDQQGTITTFTFPNNTNIQAYSFLVLKRPETNIMLNNEGDGLTLLTPDGKTEDSVTFTSASINQSYNKTSGPWQWSTTATPGATNIITALIVPTTSKKPLSKTKNSVNNNVEQAGVADISQAIIQNQDNNLINPWFLFFTALAIIIISAVAVLFIKLKLKKNVRT